MEITELINRIEIEKSHIEFYALKDIILSYLKKSLNIKIPSESD